MPPMQSGAMTWQAVPVVRLLRSAGCGSNACTTQQGSCWTCRLCVTYRACWRTGVALIKTKRAGCKRLPLQYWPWQGLDHFAGLRLQGPGPAEDKDLRRTLQLTWSGK